MEIGELIKKRRLELGMSQDDLAHKVGYKHRSSINKIEIDGRGLPQSKILAFAKALNTTPAYLLSWESEEEMHDSIKHLYNEFDELNEYLKKIAVDNAELCATLIELLNIASQLPVEKIKPIIELLKTMQ